MPDLVELFCKLVRIDSESGEEAVIIEHLKGLFERELGADCTLDDYGNLVARVEALNSQADTPILLGAHADTVKPGKGIEPVVEGGVIRSAGDTILGADDKAGIVEIFEAVRTADRRPPLEIVITREEETGLLGAKNLDRAKLRANMGFILDGDELDTVVIGGPTYIALDVEIKVEPRTQEWSRRRGSRQSAWRPRRSLPCPRGESMRRRRPTSERSRVDWSETVFQGRRFSEPNVAASATTNACAKPR